MSSTRSSLRRWGGFFDSGGLPSLASASGTGVLKQFHPRSSLTAVVTWRTKRSILCTQEWVHKATEHHVLCAYEVNCFGQDWDNDPGRAQDAGQLRAFEAFQTWNYSSPSQRSPRGELHNLPDYIKCPHPPNLSPPHPESTALKYLWFASHGRPEGQVGHQVQPWGGRLGGRVRP